MLMTPITPKVMARPMAASSSTEPSEMPYQQFCTVFQIASRFWIEAMALAAAFATGGEVLAASLWQQSQGILIAALLDDGNGGELVVVAWRRRLTG